jgi:preprotein translocase subunit SecE
MSKFKEYIDETTNELVHKVTWPTWKELQGSAIVVMIASLIIALMVWGIDMLFELGLSKFYDMF